MNQTLTKLFNTQLSEFVDLLIKFFPNNADILASQTAINALKRGNPKILLSIWTEYVFAKYALQISEGNLDFFLNKDYRDELTEVKDVELILDAIDRLRPSLRELSGQNLKDVITYLQNLNTICFKHLSLK